MRKINLGLLTFALVLWNITTHAQNLEDELRSAAQNNSLIGMSVATLCKGEPSVLYHYGKADITRDIDVTDSTMYRIASISKTITALALMKLWENSFFELDDNIDNFLEYDIFNPLFPNKEITFRMLLSHTSSLQDGSGYSPFLTDTYNFMPPPNINELLLPDSSYYTTDMWRTEEPGTYFQYSNINFGLIATLIEKISSIRFDVFVDDSLLHPLGIKGSYNIYEIENINNVAVLYRNGNPQADNYQGITPTPPDFDLYEIGSNGTLFAPQGGLRISAQDLSKIMQMMINKGVYFNGKENIQLFETATIDTVLSTQWEYDGSNGNNYYNLFNNWGLGFQKITNTTNGDIVFDGIEMYGHPGEAYGLISDMYFEYSKNYGLIFMTNGYYSGGAYQWGNYSAFYLPEEEVFTAIKNYDFDSCDCEKVKEFIKPTVKIYPNPVSNEIHFKNILEGSTLQLYNYQGKETLTTKITNNYVALPAGLPSGIYLYAIKNADSIHFSGLISIIK